MEINSANQKPSHFAANSKIIIAGAGIASLSFARALQRSWSQIPSLAQRRPAVTIYERETEQVSIEREGYSLTIRSDGASGGMQALAKLGLLDEMLRASITGVQGAQSGGFTLWNTTWEEIFKVKPREPPAGLPAPHMRIARNVLRRILVNALPPDIAVQWATACVSVQSVSSGRVQVQLSNGEVDECDILIAADGASSKLRASLRPDDTLDFAGAVCIAATAEFPNDAVPTPVDRDWGLMLGSGQGTGFFASPVDNSRAVWSLSYLAATPHMKVRPIASETADEYLEEALERGRDFGEPFPSLVRATDPATLMVFNAMDKQPFYHTFVNEKDSMAVIFIGDANHAVSPFAGNGANMALMDGVELADRICTASSLCDAVREYDRASVPRSKNAVKISRWVIEVAHAQGWRFWAYLALLRIVALLFMRT